MVLGVDFETTGLDFERDRIIEVGAVLWDCRSGVPVQMLSEMILHEEGPEVSSEIERITGITQVMLLEHGTLPLLAMCELKGLMHHAEAVVAHNGTGFDRPMLEAEIGRERSGPIEWPDLPWIDTCVDIEFPAHMATRKLTHLAAEHGFVNPFSHRALFDVLTMLAVAQHYDWTSMLASAQQPSVTLRALVGYEERQKAKDAGFRWDTPTKSWCRVVKAHRLPRDLAFETEVVA